MPHRVKITLSLAWLLTAVGAYFFMAHLGQTGPSYAVAFLGVFAVLRCGSSPKW